MLAALRNQYYCVLLLCCALFIVTFIYWPGLNGPLLFDDIPTLSRMNDYGGINSWNNLLHYLFESTGASSRVVSLLTFVLNDQAWPPDKWGIKFTNLAFHLINFLLVYLVVVELLKATSPELKKIDVLALCLAFVWAVHPINVSTVLYAIQRMAELSALFSLLAIYVVLRFCNYSGKRGFRRWFVMSFWFSLIIGIGILAKENVFVTLFIAGCFIWMFIKGEKKEDKIYREVWLFLFMLIPLLAFGGYYTVWLSADINGAWVRRPFTLDERLMTELRILVDYLKIIVSPVFSGGGIYHEDYQVSRSLGDPVSTLLALFFHFFVITIAVCVRRSYPLMTIGVVWFYIGHSMESTFIPLELYFEHRNYFPMVGVLIFFLGVVKELLRSSKVKYTFIASYFLFSGLCVFLTYERSSLWGDEERLYYTWSKENPTSSRARTQYLGYLVSQGRGEEALAEAQDMQDKIPRQLSNYLAEIYIQCLSEREVKRQQLEDIIRIAKVSVYENASYEILNQLSNILSDGSCDGLGYGELLEVYLAIGENPKFLTRGLIAGNYYYYLGKAYSNLRLLNSAMESLDQAYKEQQNATFPLSQAIWLSDAGLIDEAYRYLEVAKSTPSQTKFVEVKDNKKVQHALQYIKMQEKYWEKYNGN